MPTLQLTDRQVVDLVKQLPPERKRMAILALAELDAAQRDERLEYGEKQLRLACADRGLDWDKLSEDEREAFIDDLVHEDRTCG